MNRSCRGCHSEFEAIPNGRGRPRSLCPDCRGTFCDICGKTVRPEHTRCLDCFRAEAARNREDRWQTISDLLEQGCSDSEIASRFGWKASTVRCEVSVMRSVGWQIPYRRTWVKPAREATRPTTNQGARNRLNAAVRTGEVVRPPACERCGAERVVEGHHHDYSKPFDVEWLCRPCHSATHNYESEAA